MPAEQTEATLWEQMFLTIKSVTWQPPQLPTIFHNSGEFQTNFRAILLKQCSQQFIGTKIANKKKSENAKETENTEILADVI